MIESSASVKLKSIDAVCRRAIACLLSIQLACDIEEQNDYGESRELFLNLLKKYHVEKFLLEKEKRLFEDKYSSQDVIDVAWTYEAYWALIWVLGVIDDIKCRILFAIVGRPLPLLAIAKTMRILKVNAKSEMLKRYWIFWIYIIGIIGHALKSACGRIPISVSFNPDVVVERRKGLEWVYQISKSGMKSAGYIMYTYSGIPYVKCYAWARSARMGTKCQERLPCGESLLNNRSYSYHQKGEGPSFIDGVMKKSIKISFDDYSISTSCEKYVGRM